MSRLALLLVAAAAVASCVSATQVRHDGFAVLRVTPRTHAQLEALRQLERAAGAFSFWTDVSRVGRDVDIMVPPHARLDFADFAALAGLESTVFIEDVQKLVDSERPTVMKRAGFDWTDYHTTAEIQQWLKDLAAEFPDVVEVVQGGESYEGREILGVKVTFKAGNEDNAIFLEGGIHAREWISPATVTYILDNLLRSSDPAVRAIADAHDWYVFPSINPDGYEYTRSTNRLWRKTRKPYGFCYGADANRNWAYEWMNGGASSEPCTETFAGDRAFSEVETKSLSDYISTIGAKLTGYIAFHSYSQLLLIPYGHSPAHVENYDELKEIGDLSADALAERYGTQYEVGNIPEILYVASGGSMDWVKGMFGTRITYTYELRDQGRYGFLLPAEQIIPTGEETLDSLVKMISEFDARPERQMRH